MPMEKGNASKYQYKSKSEMPIGTDASKLFSLSHRISYIINW